MSSPTSRFRPWQGLAVALLAVTQAGAGEAPPVTSSLRYDLDYPGLNYATAKTDNPISRLQARLDAGAVLPEHTVRGRLDALLKLLDIDPSSQVLIYSKTSLQIDLIDIETPRAIYFNDHTYVGFVHDTNFIEITTIDPKLGVLFYGLPTRGPRSPQFSRETGRCLSCHDTYSMLGGGTPRVVVTSAPVIRPDGKPSPLTSGTSTDRTPVSERWGGWYVTGDLGTQPHLGNRPPDDSRPRSKKFDGAPPNPANVSHFFDTRTYLTDKSDVVPLLVLEHQANVHNQMYRASYKARAGLRRLYPELPEPQRWMDLPAPLQKAFLPLAEPLTQALLMEGVVDLPQPVRGGAGYETWFEAQGPKDPQGRSLRELDLKRQVFRRPLSYLVYTEAFDALPPYFRDYVYTRIEKAAQGDPVRREAAAILAATKPAFAAHARDAGVSVAAR